MFHNKENHNQNEDNPQNGNAYLQMINPPNLQTTHAAQYYQIKQPN